MNGLRYVRPGYGFIPNFQLFEMTECNGKNASSLYSYLRSTCPPPQKEYKAFIDLEYAPYHANDIRWNFEKFLVNRHGRVVMRFHHETKPEETVQFIEALLNGASLKDLKKLELNH